MVVVNKWIRHHNRDNHQDLIQPRVEEEDTMPAVGTAAFLRIRATGGNKDEHRKPHLVSNETLCSHDTGIMA
jgi:hypothetical protein